MSAHNNESGEPNLIPILDMVFQLITFFMLVVNFKGASMDLSLKLPVLGSARPLEYIGTYEPLPLNIRADGQVSSYGNDVDVEAYVAQEARMLKLRMEATGDQPESEELQVPVIIRADRAVDFATLNRIIQICQSHGYRDFALSAMSGQEQ